MAKVLIEFYSGKTPENLISMLNEHFDSVYFLYSAEKCTPSEEAKAAMKELGTKLLGTPPVFHDIGPLTVVSALAELKRIQTSGNFYYVDITGGDEAFIAAAGIFQHQQKERVVLHQYDVRNGTKRFSYPRPSEPEEVFPYFISAEMLLRLNGSSPILAPSYSFTTGDLKNEILRLWNAVRNRPKAWNRFCCLDRDETIDSSLLTQKEISRGENAGAYQSISVRLKNAGILKDEKKIRHGRRDYMTFRLDVSPDALFLYDKAGTLLEMYCALCAHESGLFHDIRVGVKLDWNGTVLKSGAPDPYNEIDLFLMHGNLPVVASCKNTVPQNDYLYEITVMAKHYGGFFATPALFCSGNASEGLKKRAEEMGVVLIDGIRSKAPDQMIPLIKKKFHHR